MMMLIGILAGLVTALAQSISYICSAQFMHRYHSPLRLVIYSQLVMGLLALAALPFLWCFTGYGLYQTARFWQLAALWLVLFSTGQTGFFLTQRKIEASRLSSLLGLKIIVLWVISVFIVGAPCRGLELCAVLMATVAGLAMNWSGNGKFSLGSMALLLLTLVAFSLTDMTETSIVTLGGKEHFLRDALVACTFCYVILGLASLHALAVYRPTVKQFTTVFPFALAWLISQLSLFVCFALIGAVFGNVVQSSRGIISVLFGALLLRFGYGYLDARVSRAMWIRRIMAALLMTAGIILYACAQ